MNLYAMQANNQDWWERDSTETTGVALEAGAGIDYVTMSMIGGGGKHRSIKAQATQEAGAGKGKEEHTQRTY